VSEVQIVFRADGRQSPVAAAVQRGVCRLLRSSGFAALTEFTLSSGRRADVIALSPSGEIWIVEIKSCKDDFRTDLKWPEYQSHCDRFFFALPPEMDSEIIPQTVGLIVADRWGAEVQRNAGELPLHPTRRKAVTLAIARTAALRLHGFHDPENGT
jgi:hypothetical protein